METSGGGLIAILSCQVRRATEVLGLEWGIYGRGEGWWGGGGGKNVGCTVLQIQMP